MHDITQEEKEYLAQYDITKFDRPSIAAEQGGGDGERFRELSETAGEKT